MVRDDPGLCPICGAAHTACTADSGPIVVSQLPQRDARQTAAQPTEPPAEFPAPIAVEDVVLHKKPKK